jgi:glycosyltransferase involved in cell wall biosynthesis
MNTARPSPPASLNVSVVCCTHNRVGFVRAHYELLRQHLTPSCEILYALDHCTDDTRAFLEGVSRADPQVRFVENDGPQGLFSCRNFAIAHARGRYIHYLDDDDGVSPGYYAAIDKALAAGLDGDMLITNVLMECEGQPPEMLTVIDQKRVATRSEGDATIVEGDLFDHILHGRLYFYNGNTLISRALLLQQPFRAEIRKTADWLLYLEVSHQRPLRQVYLDTVHALYRVHASSMSVAPDKSYWNMRAFEVLYGLIPADHPHSLPVRRVLARALFDAGYAARSKDKRSAARLYWRSARLGRPGPALLAMAKLLLV